MFHARTKNNKRISHSESFSSHCTLVSPTKMSYLFLGNPSLNSILFHTILSQTVEDAYPLAPIFTPSKLGFSNSNSISRRFN